MTDHNGTRARRKAEGVCVDCGSDRSPESKSRCSRCLILANPGRLHRRLAGLCQDCGAPRAPNSVSRCRACLDRNREYQIGTRDRKAASTTLDKPCRKCWRRERAAHSSMKCQACLGQSADAVRKFRANGMLGKRKEQQGAGACRSQDLHLVGAHTTQADTVETVLSSGQELPSFGV